MGDSGSILLTGATGLLGRYLLRDLLLSGRTVLVLARDARSAGARERVEELVEFWSESLGTRLPSPVVLPGDVRLPRLGLQAADRNHLASHCTAVVHAAARTALRRSPDGEPWKTNRDGTQHVLDLCRALGVEELHHVSTAFVCGERPGPVREDELECGQGFHNDYEESKFEAERRLRQAAGLRATVYRPSVIVGDSRTGYTSSYHGFYRFLDLGNRLAEAGPAGTGRRVLPLRVPFTGDEPRNLVPVDWVARAVVRVVNRPCRHGRTFHLVARDAVPVRAIKAVAEEVLAIDGVRCVGPGGLSRPTPLEEMFLEHLQEYWPYRDGDPQFDDRNTREALPDLPPPRVGLALLARLIRFAVTDEWGRRRRGKAGGPAKVNCADYVEQFFPQAARRSTLARVPLTVRVALDVRGPGGGQWYCRWSGGELVEVRRGAGPGAEAVYRTDAATFEAVVRGRLSPQEAFLARRIEIEGDVEKALKLAVLFGQFVREFPYDTPANPEATDAVPVSG